MPKSSSPNPHETKAARICRLLKRKSGADLAALQSATGWQTHSIRAALSGLRKAGYAIEHTKPASKDGMTVYRITSTPAARR